MKKLLLSIMMLFALDVRAASSSTWDENQVNGILESLVSGALEYRETEPEEVLGTSVMEGLLTKINEKLDEISKLYNPVREYSLSELGIIGAKCATESILKMIQVNDEILIESIFLNLSLDVLAELDKIQRYRTGLSLRERLNQAFLPILDTVSSLEKLYYTIKEMGIKFSEIDKARLNEEQTRLLEGFGNSIYNGLSGKRDGPSIRALDNSLRVMFRKITTAPEEYQRLKTGGGRVDIVKAECKATLINMVGDEISYLGKPLKGQKINKDKNVGQLLSGLHKNQPVKLVSPGGTAIPLDTRVTDLPEGTYTVVKITPAEEEVQG